MPAPSPLPPDEPTPISAREKRILDEIEDELSRDAGPARSLREWRHGPSRGGRRDLVARLVAVAVVAVVVMPDQWLAGFLVFVVLFGTTALGLWCARIADAPGDGGSPAAGRRRDPG